MTVFSETIGSGEHIVLFNGGLDTRPFLSPIRDQLKHRYQVTWLDQPGIGATPWQNDITSVEDLVDILLPVLPQHATYIGWSFGGLVNLALAKKYPERVKRIINLCSVPKFIETNDWPAVEKPGFQVILPDIEINGLSSFLNACIDGEFSKFTTKPQFYHTVKTFFPKDSDVDLNAVTKRIHLVDESDFRETFKFLYCPIDLILGDQDPAVPTALYEKINLLNPKANLHIIEGAQHMPFATHSDEFNQILNEILESNTA